MSSQTTAIRSRIQHLASLIESDVRRRGLVAGDAYLTAAQAGKDFGVDPFTATRAMSLLAERGVLIRKRGIGTFIGERVDEPHTTKLKHIHVLQGAMSKEPRWSFPVGQILQGLHDVLPAYQIQSTILPSDNPLVLARDLIERHTADGSLAGMLLLRCHRDIQQLVLDWHVPAVVFGGVYSTTDDLPSIDIDQFEAGRLAVQRLLDSGHRRIMVLMRENWLPGDNRFLEGINRAMSDAGATFDALITRSTAEETPAVENEIHRLLALEDRPTGLVCRAGRFAEIAQSVLHSKGLRAPDDLEIIFNACDSTMATELGLPCSCPELSNRSQATLVAQTLAEQLGQDSSGARHITLPVRLFEPTSH